MKKGNNNWRVTARHPDFDAVVAIERRGDTVLIDLPAKGNSQRKAGGKVVGYTRRNPGRRALFGHLLTVLNTHLGTARPVCVKGGKGGAFGSALDYALVDTVAGAAKYYSRGGNYRFSIWLQGNMPLGAAGMLETFGLEPTAHKGAGVEWPDLLA